MRRAAGGGRTAGGGGRAARQGRSDRTDVGRRATRDQHQRRAGGRSRRARVGGQSAKSGRRETERGTGADHRSDVERQLADERKEKTGKRRCRAAGPPRHFRNVIRTTDRQIYH